MKLVLEDYAGILSNQAYHRQMDYYNITTTAAMLKGFSSG